jgi:Family of unknown function (DUF6152)
MRHGTHARREVMTTRYVVSVLVAVAVLIGGAPAIAHHSYGHYDNARVVEVEGVIEDLQLISPHSLLKVRGDDGRVYTFEWLAVRGLQRWGISADTLHKGDRVVAGGNPRRDFEASGLLNCRSVQRLSDGWKWPQR